MLFSVECLVNKIIKKIISLVSRVFCYRTFHHINIFTMVYLSVLPASTQKLRKKISNPSQIFDTRIFETYRLHRWDNNKVACREHRIRRSVFFRFNAIANKGLSNRRSTKKPIPSLLPGARCRQATKHLQRMHRLVPRTSTRVIPRKVGRERVGGCARGVGEGNVERE